ncbi:NitT/TauT family transport system substrate-binding protein [Acetoanaerobium pronyense]|uniref:NitT/TauT family transport system substrate-binding protein n=1 Tax=Acetoanaerobium pronyense TaxID=1482736 RepID=A0ABS4KFB7_9FIRM|nr:ABC transporter substrate-binding protein [Acetoanaerobium pronyense]MBP2026470.1 NitT/TauT family transport system substrate-binding protein [Acetoanaerobium pronyense]
MNKRFIKFTKIALLFTLAMSIFAGCANNSGTQSEGSAQEEQKEMTKVVVSEFRGMNYAAVHIADALGYFEEEGIEVEFAVYGDGPVAFQGMHAGDSQFCMLSIEPVFRAFDEGLESKVVAALDTTRLYGFAGSKDITEISQLKGKTVFAGAPGSAPYSFIWSILEEGGLNPAEDVTFAQMQYGASMAALEQGTIDASYMDHYNRNKFSAIGANFLVDGADMETKKRVFGSEKFEGSIITATKKFVDENPETVQSFINGVAKGAKWLTSHSDEEVAEVLMPYHDGSTKEDLIERISLIKIAYSPDLKISEEGYEAMENFSLKTGVLKNKVGYENIIDMRFVEQAQ